MSKKTTLAEVALEVASYLPDDDASQAKMPRAMWRWMILGKAKQIVEQCGITTGTEDIDEIVQNYLSTEEALS